MTSDTPAGARFFQWRCFDVAAGAVDQHERLAERCDNLFESGGDIVSIRHVGWHDKRCSASVADHSRCFLQCFHTSAGQRDRRSSTCERQRAGATDAAAGAGDPGDASRWQALFRLHAVPFDCR